MKDQGINKALFQDIETNDPKFKGFQSIRKLFWKYLNILGVPFTDPCCENASTATGGGSSYLVYTALLTQSGTSAPVSTILQNTLGVTPVWSYEAVGQYDLIAPLGTYTENKTWVIISEIFTNDIVGKTLAVWVDTERVEVSTSDDAGLPIDGSLSGNSIEIRVYP